MLEQVSSHWVGLDSNQPLSAQLSQFCVAAGEGPLLLWPLGWAPGISAASCERCFHRQHCL